MLQPVRPQGFSRASLLVVVMTADVEDQSAWFQGLAYAWEDNPAIRDRVRCGEHLLIPNPSLSAKAKPNAPKLEYVDKVMSNLRYNVEVLEPALKMWQGGNRDAVPQADALYSEVEKLFALCYRDHPSPAYLHMDAWALRRLMTLLKSLTTKPKIPKVPCLSIFEKLVWCC